MKTVNYPEKKTYEKYDNEHFLLYLGEQQVTYLPQADAMSAGEVAEIEGYSYTGDIENGGTLIKASQADYGSFVSGLIRTKYSSNDVEALQGNMLLAVANPDSEKSKGYKQDWEEFQSFRNECKKNAKKILNL
ncbi:hypothetical protein EZS27_001357 [termite gut metagenome]|uniref:Uncharacterized protein n=1 Tax=termite gut metagenome TaxID=433724 RepID=A0A5J4T0I5_9ZZZZ